LKSLRTEEKRFRGGKDEEEESQANSAGRESGWDKSMNMMNGETRTDPKAEKEIK